MDGVFVFSNSGGPCQCFETEHSASLGTFRHRMRLCLADVLYPSASFYEGFLDDFDKTSELLTRLRIFHPIVSTILSIGLYIESKQVQERFNINTNFLKFLIFAAIFLGVTNVLSNIVLFLSIFHLAMADLLWITYIYVSLDKVKNNLPTN